MLNAIQHGIFQNHSTHTILRNYLASKLNCKSEDISLLLLMQYDIIK